MIAFYLEIVHGISWHHYSTITHHIRRKWRLQTSCRSPKVSGNGKEELKRKQVRVIVFGKDVQAAVVYSNE